MAKKTSFKNQIFQQIANQQVQQVLNQQREQQTANLMADFNSFMEQQQNPEALMADFNSWKEQNKQPVQSVSQPTVQNNPTEWAVDRSIYIDRPGDKYNKAKAAEAISKRQAFLENRKRNQGLIPSIADLASENVSNAFKEPINKVELKAEEKKKIGQRPEATDFSSQVAARPVDRETIIRGGKKWNESVNNTLNMLNSKEIKDVNAYQKLVQANEAKAAVENEQEAPAINSSINQLDLSQYNLPEEGISEQDRKALEDYSKATQWLDANYRMTKDEQKEAKRIAYEGKQALAEKYPVINKADYGKLLDRMTPEDREKYLAFEDLGNKADSLAAFSVGAADEAVKMGGGLFDTYALFHPLNPNAARSAKAYKELIQDNWNEKAEGMKELAQNATPLAENVPVIGEITPYGVGKTAAQMGAYLATNDAFDELGSMVLGNGKVAGFLGNQIGQNLQDVFLDTIPRYNELKAQGYSEEEIRDILTKEGVMNAAGNALFGGALEIPGLVKSGIDNVTAKKAADAAFRENVRAGADRLSEVANNRLPVMQDADNVVRNATKNVEQIPNLPDYVTGGPTGTYDVPKNIEPEPIKDTVEEVAKKGAFTNPDSQKILDAYRNGERLSQYEQDVLETALLEEKYDNLRRYSDDIVTVEKSDIPEDVLKEMIGDNYDNQIDSVKLSAELAKRGFNLWENGFNNNIMANYSTLLDAVAHHLAADNIPAEIMAEAYDITYKNGGTLDDAIKLAAEMAGTKLSNPTYSEGIKLSAKATEPVKETIEKVAKNGPELSAETQEQIASDFEEIYNAVEDMRSIVESSGDAKIAEKYSKLQDAVWNYEKLVYNSDSLEEINKAKKAADAARQGFIRAAKKIDPNFKGSLTGTKLGNAEFRRTSTAPTDSALLDEIVEDMVKQDMENPNRFVRDAEPDKQIDSKALRKETNNMKTSFREKAKYLRDSNNPYAKKFLNSIDEFTNNPSVDTYRKMVSAHDDYMGNYNKDVWKSSNSGYYHPEYHSEQITKRLDDIAEKYGFKNSVGNYKLQTFAGGDGPKENWKTSKFYTNTATKKGWSENLDAKDYGYRATNAQEQESVFNNRYKDSKDIVRDLVELDAFDDADMRGAMNTMEKLMDGSIDDIRKASRLGKKISFEGREGGRVVQAISEAKANTPAGQMRQAQQKIGEAIDNRVGKGTSEALDNLYEEISQAYENAKNKDEFADAIKKLLNGDLKEHVSKKTAKEMESKKIKGLKKILEMIDKGEDLKDISIDDLMEVMYKSNGGVTLSPTSQKEIYQLLQEASKYDPESYEFRSLQARAARKVMAEVPSGLRDYVRTFLYDNMLGNFKTAFSRNLFGNLAFQSLEKAREPISAGVDKIVSNFTKKHSALTWNKEKRKAFKQGIKKGAIETISDANPTKNANTLRSGQHGFEEALAHNTTTFNDNKPIGHWLNQVDYYVKKAMELGDRPIYEGNYQEFKTELEQLVQRYGKDNVAGLEKVDDADVSAVIDRLAALRAADSVFQKKGHMSKGLTHFREGLSELSKGALGIDVLSTASTPFTMTPGNMLEKAVEYTPLGAVKNGIETALELSKGSFDQRRFVEEAGRTITGLPVLGAAYGGAKLGLINNGLSNDPDEKSAQIDDGFIEYGLNIPKQVPLVGGKSYDTSDLPVYGPFMQAGAVMAEDGISPRSSLQAVEAVIGGSSLQGIRKAFGADNATYNSNDKILDNFIHTVKSSGTQFVPSLIRQTAQTTDKYKRDLGEYKTNEYYLNSIKNAVPILRETLPIKYDTEGRQVLQNQGRNAFSKVFENYILPMNVSEYKPSALNQEASRLLDSTSTHTPQGFVPKASRSDLRKWDEDVKKEYTEDQFRKYKIELGQLNSEAGHAVIEADFYKNLNDDTKAKTLSSVYSAMKTIAKENATGIETDDKIAIAYKKGGIEGMINYLTGKAAVKDSGTTSQSNAGKAIQEAADNGNSEAAYDMSAQVKLLPNYGLDKSGPAATYTKAYGVYGEGYSAEEFAKTYKAIDSDHNQGVKQDEIINYLNKEQITSQDKADQIWSAFGSDSWEYIPSIKDGVWTKKKR